MASVTLTVLDTPGLALFAFPTNRPLASWATYRVPMPGVSGRYSATIDTANGEEWGVYVNDVQPASYDLARWTQQYGEMANGSVDITVEGTSITLG